MALTLRNVVNRALAFYEFDDNLQFVETKALEAQAARDAAMMFANVFDTTALGIAGTVDGQYFTVPGTGGVYLYLYKNVAGVATLSATLDAFVGGTLTGALNEAPPVTIASAANIDIGAAASNTVLVSGTASITSLGTIAAGAIRYLRATGAFTLTHNATSLILPGGTNIVATAGDVFRFESLGSGNWRLTGRHYAGPLTLTGALNEAPPVTIASAASIDIGAAASNTVLVSGTASITSLGTIAAGAIRYLRATGAFTLTHNATSLILPGGTNIVATAGDVFRFESLGAGNWRLTGFQQWAPAAIYQPVDATLTSISATGSAADKMLYTTGVDTWAEAAITSAGRSLVAGSNAAAQLATLGTTAFNTFVSTDQTITTGGSLTLAHGLGSAPRALLVMLVCQTAELNYSVGDVVTITGNAPAMVPDATNVYVRYNSTAPSVANKTTGFTSAVTAANWKARFLAIK